MFATIFLFETAKNLLLGFMPEPLGLLIFGVAMIAFPVSLRRIFNRSEAAKEESPAKAQSAQREF